MVNDPRCSALASAMANKGVSYETLATKLGTSKQHVVDICEGSSRPTDAEFKQLSAALGIADVPHTGVHATK